MTSGKKVWLSNPSDKYMTPYSIVMLFVFAPVLILFGLQTEILLAQLFAVVATATLFVPSFIWLLWRSSLGKPEFAVVEDGFFIRYRYKRDQETFVPWNELEWVSFGDGHFMLLGHLRVGKMKLRMRKDAFDVTYDIAIAVQRAYKGPMVVQDKGGWFLLSDGTVDC